jgi:hypothetical protein
MGKEQESEKSLEEKIKEEIVKTGYPTEMQSASKMITDGWAVYHNPSFLDKDEGTCREFDIEAIKTRVVKVQPSPLVLARTPEQTLALEKGIYFSTNIRLICECKKSVDPWIFFVSEESIKSLSFDEFIHRSLVIGTPEISEKFKTLGNYEIEIVNNVNIRSSYHYFGHNNFARTYCQPFKKPEKSQQIYEAVMSCIKATLYYQDFKKANHYFVNYPVIIFNGNLFTSNIVNDEVKINEANHVQLVVNYILPFTAEQKQIYPFLFSPLGDRHKFIIDVVTTNYFEEFLKTINKEFSFTSTFVEDIIQNR